MRANYLDLHISTRKRKETFESEEVKKRRLKEAIEFNPRLRLKIKKGGTKLKEETEASLEDLKEFLIDPPANEYISIEDSSVELFAHFDFNQHQYGFFFNYFDKKESKNFDSIIHGFSNEFAISFVKDFIEKGKKELEQIEWRQIKKGSILTVGAYFFLIILFFLIPLATEYEIIFISGFISTHIEIVRIVFTYFFIGTFALSILSDRKQFKYFNKLSNREKFDTVFSLLVFIFFAVLIFVGEFDLFIK